MKKTLIVLTSVISLISAEALVVKDDVNKLLWEDSVHAEDTKVNHKEAEEYCANLELGEYKEWRLPTLTELLTIVDYKRYKPAILKEFDHVSKDTLYWTSTPYARSSDEFWGVSFKDGATSNAAQTYDRLVRCVQELK
jgi:hypothetical protein